MSDLGQDLAELVSSIIVDAYDDHEQISAFHIAFMDEVELPANVFVIGEPVSLVSVELQGANQPTLNGRCRRPDGREYDVELTAVVFPDSSTGRKVVDAYRLWRGLEPIEADAPPAAKHQKVDASQLDLQLPIELVVLGVRQKAARCRVLASGHALILRAGSLWNVVPGKIITVKGHKQWRQAGHHYLSGEVTTSRLDIAALGIEPLRLNPMGTWDPSDHDWGEEDDPLEDWAQALVEGGPRPCFELEVITPGDDPRKWDDGPILRAIALRDSGDHQAGRRVLMDMLIEDLRCLDAHTHLGNFEFDNPQVALGHYEVGLRIAELTLGPGFDGVLLWGHLDNRPFHRCLHGYGLCLWRQQRFDDAIDVYERMLRLNPSDNLGARFLLLDLRAGRSWEEHIDRGRQ
ncbi:MAG: tetratricopeptide repeat protein [Myxococcota bacterium]